MPSATPLLSHNILHASVSLQLSPSRCHLSRRFQEPPVDEQDYTKLSDIPKATRKVLSCWPFVTVTLGGCMDALIVSCSVAFMPKILQSKFRLPPGKAALLYGCSSIPAAFLGNMIGETGADYVLTSFTLLVE